MNNFFRHLKIFKVFNIFLTLICLTFSQSFSQSHFVITGKVTDSETTQPLPAASVRILGTTQGTITTADGTYRLSIEPGERVVVYSYIGCKSDSQKVDVSQNISLDIKLKPIGVQLPEVVSIAEDPALEIIRKAIANKRKWMDKLKTYEIQAFTRQILYRDTSIAGITESYTTGYWQKGDTLREIVKQKRQTENVQMKNNFASVSRITNFNDDEIKIAGYTFIGPTAPDALDYYDYKLLKTFGKSGYEIYEIKMIPKSRVTPLLEGTIDIADFTYAVMGVDVQPGDAFNIPFVKNLELKYKQQFSLCQDEFWMPHDIHIKGGAEISFIGLNIPKIAFEQTSVIYDYKINSVIPDSIFKKPRLTSDSSASIYDSTYWKRNEVLPLTKIEKAAYDSLDSSKTFDVQFRPGGISMTLFGDSGNGLSYLKYIDAHFNRVEGFYFGSKYQIDSLLTNNTIYATAGYGFSDNLLKLKLGGIQYFDKQRKYGLGIETYRKLNNVPDGNFYDPLSISFSSLIGKNDYRDYFLSSGWRGYVSSKPAEKIQAEFSFNSEWQKSVEPNSDYSFVSLGNHFRYNPPVNDGKLRSFELKFRYGNEPVFLNLVPVNAAEVAIEHSSPSILKSDYDFTWYYFSASYNFKTIYQSHLFSPVLRVFLSAGYSQKNLPLQKLFTVDTRLSSYAPPGVLRTAGPKQFVGDNFILINLEHNFRSIPFLALGIPYLYKRGIEFIISGSAAQAWYRKTSVTNKWYYETGIGIGKIFDLLRIDLTYRLQNPKKLFVTVAISTIF
jgi:hypothetical protein